MKQTYTVATIQYKILEGENFGETVHTKNWQILFWRMPHICQSTYNNNYVSTFTGQMES